MRALWAALSILVVSTGANADDLCNKTAQVAREVMKARQSGVPIDVMLGAAEKQKNGFDLLTRQLVINAYEVERRYSPPSQDREVVEFGNQAYLICAKAQ
ncbi:hypothetical protein [Metapseudomonas sp. CR1201]